MKSVHDSIPNLIRLLKDRTIKEEQDKKIVCEICGLMMLDKGINLTVLPESFDSSQLQLFKTLILKKVIDEFQEMEHCFYGEEKNAERTGSFAYLVAKLFLSFFSKANLPETEANTLTLVELLFSIFRKLLKYASNDNLYTVIEVLEYTVIPMELLLKNSGNKKLIDELESVMDDTTSFLFDTKKNPTLNKSTMESLRRFDLGRRTTWDYLLRLSTEPLQDTP